MSEWDYLPTPYENLVQSEEKHSILLILSLACLIEGKTIQPFEIFELVQSNESFSELIDKEVERIGILGLIRTLLQFEDVRSEKKRNKIIGLINSYKNAKRNGTKNLQSIPACDGRKIQTPL